MKRERRNRDIVHILFFSSNHVIYVDKTNFPFPPRRDLLPKLKAENQAFQRF